MKVRYFFRCVDCGHILKSRDPLYFSPCPKCNGDMIRDRQIIDFLRLANSYKPGAGAQARGPS